MSRVTKGEWLLICGWVLALCAALLDQVYRPLALATGLAAIAVGVTALRVK